MDSLDSISKASLPSPVTVSLRFSSQAGLKESLPTTQDGFEQARNWFTPSLGYPEHTFDDIAMPELIKALQTRGVEHILLDLDGTLARPFDRALSASVVDRLRLLDQHDFSLAVATNNRFKRFVHHKLQVPKQLSTTAEKPPMLPANRIFTHVGKRSSDATGLMRVLEILGWPAKTTALITDQPIDVASGNRAGLVTVQVKPLPGSWLGNRLLTAFSGG